MFQNWNKITTREVMQKFHGNLRICDLGSAGGKNSLDLLAWILPLLKNREVEYIFEDLPNADINQLAVTVHQAQLPSNIKAR